MYDFYFNDWPNFCPSWNLAMNTGSRITCGECIFFALSINSSVSVWHTWFCDEGIVRLNFLSRCQITKPRDLTVQGHVIECFHISAEPVSGSLYQSRSRYQRSVLHLLLRSSSTLGLYIAHNPTDPLVPQILSTRIVNTRGNF